MIASCPARVDGAAADSGAIDQPQLHSTVFAPMRAGDA